MNTAPLFDKHDPTTTVNTRGMSIYEGRLDHGSKQSIPHFGGKDKTVKHMLALCSIFWQAHLRKASEKGRRQYSFNVLPRYATQCGIAAKRCFTASCCLIALDQPGSVEIGQDMLHKRCLHGGKITITILKIVPAIPYQSKCTAL